MCAPGLVDRVGVEVVDFVEAVVAEVVGADQDVVVHIVEGVALLEYVLQ